MADDDRLLPGRTEGTEDLYIRTFLVADVRGYTLFTQDRGDEAAGKLAAKFARLAREGVEGRGGTLLELRGDEALCVFASPRQAIRAASSGFCSRAGRRPRATRPRAPCRTRVGDAC